MGLMGAIVALLPLLLVVTRSKREGDKRCGIIFPFPARRLDPQLEKKGGPNEPVMIVTSVKPEEGMERKDEGMWFRFG